jgi:hypothetical protein
MAFCMPGQHASLHAFEYDGMTWCPEHLPPSGPADPAQRGVCTVGREHKSEAVYWVAVMGRYACRRHLTILIAEVIRRGEYGT